MYEPMTTPKYASYLSYLKLNSYTLKNWKIIREPPECTGNEPTLDILT